ncbi:MAG: hypothetical protein ACE5DK_07850 [Paracoccaceae bacterium]
MPTGNSHSEYQLVPTHFGLRMTVGTLGLAIPILLFLTSALAPGVAQQPSISHYYYTPMRDALMGALFAVAVFLLAYRGYRPLDGEWLTDRRLSLIAGCGLIAVVVMPAAAIPGLGHPGDIPSLAAFFSPRIVLVAWIHRIGAALFMGALGIMSLVNFRRDRFAPRYSAGLPAHVRAEHLVFVGAGVAMLGAVALIALEFALGPGGEFFANSTFWLESLGVFSFGCAWVTKTKILRKLIGTGG